MATRLLSAFRKADLPNLTPGARFVLWAYCDLADSHTLSAFPSTELLMRLTGMAERSIQRHRDELVTAGHMLLVQRGGGRRRSSTYRVTLGESPTDAAAIPPAERERLAGLGLL